MALCEKGQLRYLHLLTYCWGENLASHQYDQHNASMEPTLEAKAHVCACLAYIFEFDQDIQLVLMNCYSMDPLNLVIIQMYNPSVSSAVEVHPDHNLLVSCYSNVQPVINHDNAMFPKIFAIKQLVVLRKTPDLMTTFRKMM